MAEPRGSINSDKSLLAEPSQLFEESSHRAQATVVVITGLAVGAILMFSALSTQGLLSLGKNYRLTHGLPPLSKLELVNIAVMFNSLGFMVATGIIGVSVAAIQDVLDIESSDSFVG